MAAFGEQLSGLAGKIRTSTTSEQFDFSNFDELRTKQTLTAAFSQPLTAPKEMVRFQFIVGGGKLVRGNYNDNLIKWCAAAMRDIGFVEDSSASCLPECQGTYKSQHDTSQNLKYFYVFPHVNLQSEVCTEEEAAPKLDTKSKDYLVVAADVSTFQEMVQRKVISWGQKKRLLKILQTKRDEFQTLEEKLMKGDMLQPIEQEIYDANSGCDAEKIDWLQSEMKAMVDKGDLTASEKTEKISEMTTNLQRLAEDVDTAKAAGQQRVVEELSTKINKILAKKKVLEDTAPVMRRLIHGEMIQKCWSRLLPLEALEEKGRSMKLTLQDLKTLEEKADIEEQMYLPAKYNSSALNFYNRHLFSKFFLHSVQMQNASRGWFEEEGVFQEMCQSEEKEARKKYKSKMASGKSKSMQKKSSGIGGSSSRTAASGWATVGSRGGSRPTASSAPSKKSGFAEAFVDSSSDED